MKKLIIILLTPLFLSASLTDIEKNIYKAILYALFPQKKVVKIWTDEPKKEEILKKIDIAKIAPNIDSADILFIYHKKTLENIKNDKIIIFVGKYSLIKDFQNRVIGGFFWQKGRPNIIFLRKNLEKFNIKLSTSFQKYIEEKI